MDLLQKEQSSRVRLPLTCIYVQLQLMCRTYTDNMQQQKILLVKARPEWEMAGTGFFQRK